MRVPTAADTPELERIVNKACKSAHRKRNTDFKNDAVNWADLYFAELETNPRVIVEEASPDATELRKFIEGRLWDAGFDVEVVTEW